MRLFQRKKRESPYCTRCEPGHHETIEHIITECPAYNRMRQCFYTKIKTANRNLPPNVQTLLMEKNCKLWPPLLKFLKETEIQL